jgi:hypothetical protein
MNLDFIPSDEPVPAEVNVIKLFSLSLTHRTNKLGFFTGKDRILS